jgi:hypothetical protein
MPFRIKTRVLLWAVFLSVGCSSASSGCGSCLGPIPGGFPPAERQPESASIKLSASGITFAEQQAQAFIAQAANLTNGLVFDVPCVKNPVSIGLGQSVDVFACDMNNDGICDTNDNDPSLRYDPAGRFPKCQVNGQMQAFKLTPVQNADGTVSIAAEIDAIVNTGKIPITASTKLPIVGTLCGLSCTAEFNSDINAPPFIPIKMTINLTIDAMHGDILAFDLGNVDDFTKGIDPTEFSIAPDPGSCSALNFICSASNTSFLKTTLLSLLKDMVKSRLQNTIDGARCVACDQTTGACPSGATCESGLGLCYYNYAMHSCPTNELGIDGRLQLGSTLAGFGGPTDATLDVYAVAGGRNTPGQAASTRVQNGGLQVGMLGGTHAPAIAACAQGASFTPEAPPPPMDFDAELTLPGPGGDLSGYQVGLSLSNRFLDKALFDAYADGLICLDVAHENVSLLSSSLFGALLPNLPELTHGENVPMLIALRPTKAPTVVIGRGTTKTDAAGHPADPLLTITIPQLHIDFYAFIEQRYARLFTVQADLALPLTLDVDSLAGTLTPVLGDLNMLLTKVTAINNEMNAANSAEVAAIIPALVNVIQPQLAGILKPLSLPSIRGYMLTVLGIRGSVKDSSGSGYSHMALFTEVGIAAQPDVAPTKTSATLVDSFVPAMPLRLEDPATQPRATIDAHADGLRSLHFKGYEFSYRVDGGFWSSWNAASRFVVASPALRLQGRHTIEVRSREIDQPSSIDRQPVNVPFVVDYAPPDVKLALMDDTQQVTTIAHDAVTADAVLVYRYRAAGAPWGEWGGAQAFALSSLGLQPSVEVDVRDQAGHVGHAVYGTPADMLNGSPSTSAKKTKPLAETGCSNTSAGVLGLLGLFALRRRPRA